MDSSKLEALKQRYRAWSTADLVRAITLDMDQYDPGAVELMKGELEGRHIAQSERDALQASIAESGEEQTKNMSGIRGSLFFFVLVVVGNSTYVVIVSLLILIRYANLALFIEYAPLLAVGAYGLFVFRALIDCNPSAPRHATNWLIIMCIVNALYGVVSYLTGVEMPGSFVHAAIFSVIWLTYIPHSKRVAATYGRETSLQQTALSDGSKSNG